MKRKFLSLLLILAFIGDGVFAQATDSTKYIIGSWKFTKESLQPVANFRLEQLKKDNPAVADQVDIEMIVGIISQAVYKYNSDGTYKFSSPQGTDEGIWKLTEDKKGIYSKSNSSGKETTRMIVKVSEKVLSLKLSETIIANYEPAK